MQTLDIMGEIKQLPLIKKIWVVEETLKAIKKEEIKIQLELGAKDLYEEYTNNKELTIFTTLDFENFYETK
jgi:hypothetical protein